MTIDRNITDNVAFDQKIVVTFDGTSNFCRADIFVLNFAIGLSYLYIHVDIALEQGAVSDEDSGRLYVTNHFRIQT